MDTDNVRIHRLLIKFIVRSYCEDSILLSHYVIQLSALVCFLLLFSVGTARVS